MIAREITARVEIAGVDVTTDVSNNLRSIEYEDCLSGETDTITLEFHDVERRFISDWFPQRGDTLRVDLIKRNWDGVGTLETLSLGLFEIDEVSNSYPPSVCKLKGNSCSENSALRQVKKSKAWENVKLSAIAADIAQAAQVSLVYEASDDPLIQRAEQAEVSSLAFLDKLCADYYLSVKVADGKLIVFDTEQLERQEVVASLIRDETAIKDFSGTATLSEVYKAVEVNYSHGKHAEQYSARAEDATKPSGKTLTINQKVDSQSAAEKLARHKLREKNREEVKISITTMGDFALLSGNVIELKDHGFYSGRYLIKKAHHKIGDRYDVHIDCYKCLE